MGKSTSSSVVKYSKTFRAFLKPLGRNWDNPADDDLIRELREDQRIEATLLRWIGLIPTEPEARSARHLVVQADFLNAVIDDTVLVQITSSIHGLPNTEVLIDPAIETNSGLRKICVVSCINLLTFDQGFTLRTIGFLSPATMRQVERCLRTTLGIP